MLANRPVPFRLAFLYLLCLALFACKQESPTPNTILDFDVVFDEPSGSYGLTWQASRPEGSVTLSVATPGQDFEVIANDLTGQDFSWKPSSDEKRYLFKLSPAHGQPAISATRWLTLEGGKNFRELGGYSSADGSHVRWGKLFRSGAMSGLTNADYRELEDLGIATIVDFRTPQERAAEPTQWQDANTDLLTWDTQLDIAAFGNVFREPDITPEKVEAATAALYPEILRAMTTPYTAMFDRLAASDEALVFNCTAGKDRTGVAAALILTALGVDRETVVEDFMLSDVYYNEMMDMHKAFGSIGSQSPDGEGEHAAAPHQPMQDMMAAIPPEALRPLAGVRESYLDTVFAAMEQQSGSVLAYIQQELQVSDEELARLRSFYLEPAEVAK